MPTIQELMQEYEKYSDEELLGVWTRLQEYTPEAKEALKAVFKEKGGPEALVQRVKLQAERTKEIQRLTQEAGALLRQGLSPSQMKDQMKSTLLGSDQIIEIVHQMLAEQERETKDRKVTPGTFLGGLLGGLIGGTVGGIIFGISMIQSDKIMYIFGLGVVMVCYGCVHFFTRKTSRNNLVVIATVLASVYAFALASLIYGIYR